MSTIQSKKTTIATSEQFIAGLTEFGPGREKIWQKHRRLPEGAQDIDVDICARGQDLKGRLLGALLGIVGKGQLEKWFAKALKAIEGRNYEAGAAVKA